METAINNNLRTNANTFKYNIQVYIYNKYIIYYCTLYIISDIFLISYNSYSANINE